MIDSPQVVRIFKTHQAKLWKSEISKCSSQEIQFEWQERGDFQSPEEFMTFLEENKNYRLSLEEIPFEWVQELGWSWSQTARALQCFDELILKGNRWQANLNFPEALRLALVEVSETFDLSRPAYLVGHGERMRISAYVLSVLGFRRIFCLSPDSNLLNQDLKILQRFLFGMQMISIEPQTLTQQTENGSLVISTYFGENKLDLSQDMAYFNYMAPRGLVLDFEPESDQSYFIEEAKKADMRILPLESITQNYLKNMTRV